MMFHLLNHDLKEPALNIRIDLALPAVNGVRSITRLSPDDGCQKALPFNETGGGSVSLFRSWQNTG